jgi:hypothetical protein
MQSHLIIKGQGIVHRDEFPGPEIGNGYVGPVHIIGIVLIDGDKGVQCIVAPMKLDKDKYVVAAAGSGCLKPAGSGQQFNRNSRQHNRTGRGKGYITDESSSVHKFRILK